MPSDSEHQTLLKATEVESPIINSPFLEPQFHWHIEQATPPVKNEGRRSASYFFRIPERAARGRRKQVQTEMFESEKGEEVDLTLVNEIRMRVKDWREGIHSGGSTYDGISPVTRELLALWRSEERMQRLFFAQVEAAETIIFLFEAKQVYRKEVLKKIPLDRPSRGSEVASSYPLIRYACKMATGTGKTTVMGMLAAWSILNRVASPRDNRFSDTILIVCPNVTIRERLKELDPALGDLSLYRTRQLVPTHRMEELRRGEVMITNWHRLEKKETNTVNGNSAKVVKAGEPVAVLKKAGKPDQSVETKYFESDAAWFKRIRHELGNSKGRCLRWLVFNDEAHHAYRRGDAALEESLDEDTDLAKKNAREATVWVEGLDRINKLAGGKGGRGINFCLDFSATPFYLQGTGNEVGKPFPWIVSDFGLIDAIESGLVKIPQLPSRDVSGAEEAAYFNIWRWVQSRAKEDGLGSSMTPEIVMNYAGAPINLLAQEWHERFMEWKRFSKDRQKYPVPPVFIVVCSDTAIAREVHNWLANGNDSYGDSPSWFRNELGQEVTVRIDSKVIEDIERGGTKDETKRLRFILDTVGKAEWPGGKVPEGWAELVRKHNDKVASDDNNGSLKWVDESVPPGRDVRCIVSVLMLSEGWDANTVMHIVGLRPFGSQLLCEQVVGRALRRKSYALDEETQMFAEETAKVFGVPFEMIPFKVNPNGPPPPPRKLNHIFSVLEKSEYEITFPIVTGYHQSGSFKVFIDWEQISKVTINPRDIPPEVEVTPLVAPDGSLAAYGPGEKPVLSLEDWRARFRDQQVAFRLAREVCSRWQEDNGAEAVPIHVLFSKVVIAAKRFLVEKLVCEGDSQPCDILLVGEYMQAARSSLMEAIKKGRKQLRRTEVDCMEVAVIPQGRAGLGRTLDVDFHTTKPVYPATRCHLNAMVADSSWERSAVVVLDSHPGVKKWVKNDRLGFFIYYKHRDRRAKYIPDFIVETDKNERVIVEIKGQFTDKADVKAKAADRWVRAVNCLGTHGVWHYLLVTDLGKLRRMLNKYTIASSVKAPVRSA